MREMLQDQLDRSGLMRVLPMYVASYAVLLCGLGAYVTTYEEETFGPKGIFVVLVGFGVSLFCRWRGMRQNTMFGILAALVVLLLFWGSVNGGMGPGDYLLRMASERNSGPGMVLAWFLVLYAFAMISDEVIVFSVVPSIALLGLMASDNLNPEIVVYFLGLTVSAVFLLVYENMLSRGVLDRPAPDQARGRLHSDGTTHGAANAKSGNDPDVAVEPAVRVSLLLTSVVAALAIVVGFAASVPLSFIGQTISDRTPQINLPAAAEFASNIENRYISQLQLDGTPPRLSDRVVMQIQAPEPFYWRSRVFHRYTGFSWTSDSKSQIVVPVGGYSDEWRPRGGYREGMRIPERHFVLSNRLDMNESKARRPVSQVVHLVDPPVGGMLVSAAEPESLWIPTIRRRLFEDPDRGLSIERTRAGSSYRVKSQVSSATPDQLRRAGTDYPVALKSKFTQLEPKPEDVPPYRHKLALKITAPFDNPYDKVRALEGHLRENYLYSLTPPRTPRNEDAVNFFLTKSKQGYCEIFASSMAVLAREVGIPARLATGFAPGEWKRNELGVEYAEVREKDLHAWTEVYFPGYGWIPFDPTASRTAQDSWTASFKSMLRSLFAQVSQYRAGPMLILLSMLSIGAFLLKTYAVDPLRGSAWWNASMAPHRRGLSPDQRWDLLYARSHRRMKRLAGAKAAHQTPYEYASAARASVHLEAADAFDRLTDLYVHRSFQRGGPDDADIQSLLRLDTDLRRALRRKPQDGAVPATA